MHLLLQFERQGTGNAFRMMYSRWLFGKVPDGGKDWGQKERKVSEDEMAGRHHQGNEHKLGKTLGDGEGQGGLACCSPRGHKQSDTTGWLNDNRRWCRRQGRWTVLELQSWFPHTSCPWTSYLTSQCFNSFYIMGAKTSSTSQGCCEG